VFGEFNHVPSECNHASGEFNHASGECNQVSGEFNHRLVSLTRLSLSRLVSLITCLVSLIA
jgi:hypothetical protein